MAAAEPKERRYGSLGPGRFPIYAPSESMIVAPLGVSTGMPNVGDALPQLSRVHGFSAQTRPPVVFLSERRCACAAGRLVVELDIDDSRQRFMSGHSDIVSCLAHSEEQALGASGQMRRAGAKWAEVLLWDSETLEVRGAFQFHKADIEAIGFVQNGEILVTIGTDRDRTMALWPSARDGFFRAGRREGAPLAVCSAFKGGGVCGIVASPGGPDEPVHFATFGVQHVKFWQSARVKFAVDGRRGAFGSEGAPKVVVCAAWVARERLVAGSSNGEIFFFEGNKAIRKLVIHPFSIALLLPLKDSLAVVHSHGVCSLLKGGAETAWDLASLLGAPESRMQTPLTAGHGWRGSSLVLASRTHLVFVDLSYGIRKVQDCKVLLSQPSEPLAAVCAHTVEPRIYTGALDGGVRCYRSGDLRPIEARSFKASCGVTCIAVSSVAPGSEGSAWLALGCEDSTLSIMGETNFHYVLRKSLSGRKAKLTCARFSATDASCTHPLWLAVGTDDGCIHTFRFKEPTCRSTVRTGEEIVSKVATLRGHEAAIIDFCFADTLPCLYLTSVDASGKQLAFDVPMARRLPTLSLVQDVPFTPWTLPTGWQVQGCWHEPRSPEHQRRFFEIPGRQAIVASDCSGTSLEMFPYPCMDPLQSKPPRLEGPGSPITSLLFSTFSDSILATSGTALFSWSWSQSLGSRKQEPDRGLVFSPLRQVQGAVVFDTPDGRKRAVAASPTFTPPPRARPRSAAAGPQRSAAKENMRGPAIQETATCPNCGSIYMADALFCRRCGQKREDPRTPEKTPPRKRASSAVTKFSSPDIERLQPSSPAAARSKVTAASPFATPPSSAVVSALASPEAERGRLVGEVPTFGAKPSQAPWTIDAPVPAGLPSRQQKSDVPVAGKIGAPQEGKNVMEVVSEAQRIHEDMDARTRSIQERQQFDSVGLLLSGKAQANVVGVDRLEDRYQESRAGRFQQRAQESNNRYEVEVRLPGGRLLRVTRNPLRRTLSFEGQFVSHRAVGQRGEEVQDERLLVRVPPGYDLSNPPADIIRNFGEGRCFVALHRYGQGGRSDRSGAGVVSKEEYEL